MTGLPVRRNTNIIDDDALHSTASAACGSVKRCMEIAIAEAMTRMAMDDCESNSGEGSV